MNKTLESGAIYESLWACYCGSDLCNEFHVDDAEAQEIIDAPLIIEVENKELDPKQIDDSMTSSLTSGALDVYSIPLVSFCMLCATYFCYNII